jgi:hypothetical protein
MTEDLPSFDPDHETPPVQAPKPPKKPRRKPTKKRKARAPVVTRPRPKKQRGRNRKSPKPVRSSVKRRAKPGKIDRRTKAFRQSKKLQERMRDTDAIAELKAPPVKAIDEFDIAQDVLQKMQLLGKDKARLLVRIMGGLFL